MLELKIQMTMAEVRKKWPQDELAEESLSDQEEGKVGNDEGTSSSRKLVARPKSQWQDLLMKSQGKPVIIL